MELIIEQDRQIGELMTGMYPVKERAKALILTPPSQAWYDEITAYIKMVNGFQREAQAQIDKIKRPLNEARANLLDQERKVVGGYEAIKKELNGPAASWFLEQERLRKEAEAEMQRKAQKLRDDAALLAAEQAKASGNAQKAEAIIEQAARKQAPAILTPKTVGAAGTTMVTRYSVDEEVEPENLMLLVKAVAEGRKPVAALMINATFLNAEARALKESFDYPGVRLVAQTSQRG